MHKKPLSLSGFFTFSKNSLLSILVFKYGSGNVHSESDKLHSIDVKGDF